MQLYSIVKQSLIFLLTTFLLYSFVSGTPRALASDTVYPEWESLLGGRQADRGLSARQTGDGGFIVVGETSSYYMHGNGGQDVLVIKTDSSGRPQWQKAYGGVNDDRGVSVRQTADGGYVIAGATQSSAGGKDRDVYLLKIDGAGRRQWEKSFGGSGEDWGAWVEQTADGGFVVAGATSPAGAVGSDIYLIKTGHSGNLEWEQTFDGRDTGLGVCVVEAPGGGYVVAGQTFSPASGGFEVFLAKTGADGGKEWEKTFGGKGWDLVESIAPTADGGCIVTGRSSSFNDGGFTAYLVKTDAAGTPAWEKTFPGDGWSVGKYVRQTGDGYLMAGWTSPGGGATQARIIETGPDGSMIREIKCESSRFNRDFSILPAWDGAYVIAGWWAEPLKYNQYRNDGTQVYLAKLSTLQHTALSDGNAF